MLFFPYFIIIHGWKYSILFFISKFDYTWDQYSLLYTTMRIVCNFFTHPKWSTQISILYPAQWTYLVLLIAISTCKKSWLSPIVVDLSRLGVVDIVWIAPHKQPSLHPSQIPFCCSGLSIILCQNIKYFCSYLLFYGDSVKKKYTKFMAGSIYTQKKV